ncbi:MAG TPA: hypothetical protein VMH61_08075 [Candidatus Acidoferrales bacterium]|nr:hypothetical protein [Candidatus Acidoferrales bacterium]
MPAPLLPLLVSLLAAASPGAPTLRCASDTLHADADQLWTATLQLHNGLEYGLYGDSLVCEITDLSTDVCRCERHQRQTLSSIAGSTSGISAGEDSPLLLSIKAISERAHIVYRAYVHDGQKKVYVLSDSVEAEGGELFDRYPSRLVNSGGTEIEIVTGAAASASASVPGVLLVPDDDATARRLVATIDHFVQRGWNVVAVSPPGYGRSGGRADLGGPATQAALDVALKALTAMPGADRKRIAVWGTGRGAQAALLFAASHPELCGVVAIDAVYDLWASWRAAPSAGRSDILAEAGRDSAGWRSRSPLVSATAGRVPRLVVESAGAPGAGAARAFALACAAHGASIDTLFMGPPTPHSARRDPARTAVEFLTRVTTP